ncbi:MAG: GxxExxY protein [Pseudomonadota bacterium]
MLSESRLSGAIVDAACEVHSILGPGLLESVYEAALVHELRERKLAITRQTAPAVAYKRLVIPNALMLIGNRVIVELQAADAITNVHKQQLLTYLWRSGYQPGLLINFNTDLIKNVRTRLANGL